VTDAVTRDPPTQPLPAKSLDPLAPGISVIYSHLAMHFEATLDRTFQALADGTRRSMIATLARGGPCSAGELGRQFRSAQPTISRHIKVLEQAGLVERTVEGRVHRFRLRDKQLDQARSWIARHQQFWEGAADELDRLLAEQRRGG